MYIFNFLNVYQFFTYSTWIYVLYITGDIRQFISGKYEVAEGAKDVISAMEKLKFIKLFNDMN